MWLGVGIRRKLDGIGLLVKFADVEWLFGVNALILLFDGLTLPFAV